MHKHSFVSLHCPIDELAHSIEVSTDVLIHSVFDFQVKICKLVGKVSGQLLSSNYHMYHS